jgi:hypothetical protein
MLAGTDTTATLLPGLTCILSRNPEKLARLPKEARDTFSCFNDTTTKLSQLVFLSACMEEALRMYPPLPVGLPRKTSEGGATVCGRCVAGEGSNCFSKFHTIFCWYTNTNRLSSGTVPRAYNQSHADQLETPREFRARALYACRPGGVSF